MCKLSLCFYNIAFTACPVLETDNRGASEIIEGALVKCRCNEPKEQLLSTTLPRITMNSQRIIIFASHYSKQHFLNTLEGINVLLTRNA